MHYSRPCEVAKGTAQAQKTLDNIFCKNEASLLFDKFISILNKAFFDLAYGQYPRSKDKKVDLMTRKINSNDPDICAAVQVVAMLPALSSNFTAASKILSKKITHIHPAINSGRKRSYRSISSTNLCGNRGRGGCVGHGHG
eukprot:6761782-Ditylum_brightwellii.AAC.1